MILLTKAGFLTFRQTHHFAKTKQDETGQFFSVQKSAFEMLFFSLLTSSKTKKRNVPYRSVSPSAAPSKMKRHLG